MIKDLILGTLKHFRQKNASQMGAALSYYMIFALIPFSLIIISLSSIFLGQEMAYNSFLEQVSSLIGNPAADFISSGIRQLENKNNNFWSVLVIVITMVFATAKLLSTLNNSLDTLWELKPKKDSNMETRIQKSVLRQGLNFSILPIFSILFIFLISGSVIFGTYLSFINRAIFFILGCAFFTFVFRVSPFRILPMKELLLGGIMTSLLFFLGKTFIGLYINNVLVNSILGGFSSLVLLLVWIYYSAQVFFLGASTTYVYSKKYGSLSKKSQ